MPEGMGYPVIPLSEDELARWRGDVQKAQHARKTVAKWWEANLQKYAPEVNDDPEKYGGDLNTNRDFTLVERKKADLFYQRPDITAVPSPLMAGQEQLLETHTAILNEKLGPDGVNAKSLVHRVLFDVLCPSGTGWSKMGYESVTVPTETIDPTTGQPTMADVPIYENCFWEWFSPKQALIPADFKSTDWDKAPWLGFEFEMPVRVAKRKGWVPEDFEGNSPSQDLHFDHGLGSSAGEAVVRGCEIHYKSALYRDDRIHPLHMTQLVLIEGVDTPAVHQDSPYQTLDDMGRLTPDSLIGFPIHPLTIRTLTDSAHVPSDCTISRPIVNELNRFRSQMVEQRDAAILRWMYNTDTLPTDAVEKMVRSPIGGMIGVPGEAFVGEGAIKEMPHGSYPRENFAFQDYLDNDIARTHALDANQAGSGSEGDTTATESQIQQANVNARLGFERGIVLDWWLKGVTKYSALVQRLLPVETAAQIVGPQKAQEWDSWRKMVPASLAFTALPDSTLRTDIASERKRAMDEYTYFANDPFINRVELLKKLVRKLNYDQSVINPQPPKKQAEPTKPGFSFKGEDLNPLNPQFPIVMEILRQSGLQISPAAVQEAQAGAMNMALLQQAMGQDTGEGKPGEQTEHGGKVAQMEGLDKHQTDETGGMQGTGQPAAMGAGGGF